MERLSQGRRAGAGAAGVQRGQASSGAHVCTPLLGPATLPCVAVTVGLGEHTVTQAHRTLSLGRAGPMAAHGRAGRGQSGFLWVRAGAGPDPDPGVCPSCRRQRAAPGAGEVASVPFPRSCPTPWGLFPERREGGGGDSIRSCSSSLSQLGAGHPERWGRPPAQPGNGQQAGPV